MLLAGQSLPGSWYCWHLTGIVVALGLPPVDSSSSRLARCPFHPLNSVAIYTTAGVYKASHIRITSHSQKARRLNYRAVLKNKLLLHAKAKGSLLVLPS